VSEFKISRWEQSSILYVYSQRRSLDMNPEYQRQGDIWPEEKRQLLVDSVLNGFDVPKFYVHELQPPRKVKGQNVNYAIVDGKQRLSALWDFIDGRFSLDTDFELIADKRVKAGGMTYAELASEYPDLKIKFDGTSLAIISIQTDDVELIEEMFTRLNEAAPLNAAEKRNAFGGPMPKTIRAVARTPFFAETLPFGNKRYRHFDLAAKFLQAEHRDRVVDTKKVYLDEFVKGFRGRRQAGADKLGGLTKAVLEDARAIFRPNDPLLRRVGTIVVYYHLLRLARREDAVTAITRDMLEAFEEVRLENRRVAEVEISKANYDWLEFDRLNQTPNDQYAIDLRLDILSAFLQDQYGLPALSYK